MPKQKPPRPPDLRRTILDASLVLLEQGGVAALSMREVARRANVTHGAPYHHFVDRGAILAALAEEGFALLAQGMREAMEREAVGSIARFEAAGLSYVGFALEHPGHMRIMFRPELAPPLDHPGIDEGAKRAMRLLVDCVVECQRAGTIAAGDPTPIVLTSWATVHGLASLWIDGSLPRLHPGVAPEELARIVAGTLGALLRGEADRRACGHDGGDPHTPGPAGVVSASTWPAR
jgi:AcrR family transcriptional regulator